MLGWIALASVAHAAPPAAAVFQSGPGRFEVSAVDAAAAKATVDLAADCWQHLAVPLGLPESFSSPIFCRLIPAAEWAEPAPFRVIVESGGIVSLRLRADATLPEMIVRRGLVQALLMRLAVAQHGVNGNLSAPLWLELGGVEWWRTRSAPAQFDALKYASARMPPPALTGLLSAQRGESEPAALTLGSAWLLAFLQAESGRANEWPAFLSRLLGGEDAAVALSATFPGKFSNGVERELWWQTGWHHLRRGRSLPTLEADESQRELGELTRFVFASEDGRDAATPMRVVVDHAREPIVEVELQRRAGDLNRLLPALHPFFRNAGLSLAEVFAQRHADDRRRSGALAAFERDWSEALELAATSRAALDARERRP